MHIIDRAKQWARRLKSNVIALWFAYRDPRTPTAPKLLGIFVVAYALSPIDLIPDFIPVLGFVDDVLILPGLIWLAIRLIPASLLEDCRRKAAQWIEAGNTRPTNYVAAAVILMLWAVVAWAAYAWFAAH